VNCRSCGAALSHTFLDLGFAPPSNAYLTVANLTAPERYYPLKLLVCNGCWLVQTEDYAQASELFNADYAYFSSTSTSWLQHAADYATAIMARLQLRQSSLVIEIASNDGYLLKNFLNAGVPCLGIEPTASTAAAAEAQGIPVLREFFGETLGRRLTQEGRQADLIAGNNVYAHVPDINDFTRGLRTALKPGGTVTLEFPHLLRLIEQTQFDTVYHEHFSYLSLYTVAGIFANCGLRVYDVEQLLTHGGSLRVYGCHAGDVRQSTPAVADLIAREEQRGLRQLWTYDNFQARADRIKDDLLAFLIESKRAGKAVAGYGAAAKGNTLINYAGVKRDLLAYVCDAAAAKQGKFLPGSHIPIRPPQALAESKPDFVLILPWNLKTEVMQQLSFIRKWGGQFVCAVPQIVVQ
jgi:SAM-dependent methyltransferase